MRLRRVPPSAIMQPMIKSHKAGIMITSDQLGSPLPGWQEMWTGVIDALIATQRAEIDLSFERAAAIDLAGRDVLESCADER